MVARATFRLTATRVAATDAHTPRVLSAPLRSAGPGDDAADDPFVPRGLLTVDEAFDLSPASRGVAGAEASQQLEAAADRVVVLEMPDGVTVITHPQTLHDAIARIDPASLDADGAVALDRALAVRSSALRGVDGASGHGLASLLTGVASLAVAPVDAIVEAARRLAGPAVQPGIGHAGTQALMAAIEGRLKRDTGLFRWPGNGMAGPDIDATRLHDDAAAGPLLVLIHGTGSTTAGSFDGWPGGAHEHRRAIEHRYADRVLAFEHRSLSDSPIDNALQLARALPSGARIDLLTHSRGGLVGDLLCIVPDANLEALIDAHAGPTDADDAALQARAAQRDALRELAAELARKRFAIGRYVRVASPARGTRLVSGNLEVFLSGLLSVMGWVPALRASPAWSAFKRVVIEVARHRIQPQWIPGLEAMLPESPLPRLLARATAQPGLQLAAIAGDIEGGGWLKRLAVLFTDFTFFDAVANDLVVDTDAMSAGIARPGNARLLVERGPEVHHFRYFANDVTRDAARRWLTEDAPDAIDAFKPLRGLEPAARPLVTRSAVDGPRPTVLLLPGTMGTHLWTGRRERIWFDLPALLQGGLGRLRLPLDDTPDPVEAETLFAAFYGDLQTHLEATHRVVAHPYDWRQPLPPLADALALALRAALDHDATQPVRVMAHSMGGLVVRALIHRHPALWDEAMARPGARFVMLGTPNQGSHLMVETLVGKAATARKLAVLDQRHDLQQVVDLIAGFPGALALLPKPGFVDTGNSASTDYFDADGWTGYRQGMRDFWFGDGIGALPDAASLARARWLWEQDGTGRPSLPEAHGAKTIYVAGVAPHTPCGIVRQGDGESGGDGARWKMLGTPHGDGSVTWASGWIGGIGQRFYMPAEHGALADTDDWFDSLTELLEHGSGGSLLTAPPAVRDARAPLAATYDAGPVPYPTERELAAGLFGRGSALRARERPRDAIKVRVRAMDLRQVTQPILVGHYEQDAIAGPEALIDRWLAHGELSVRHHLGLYAGAVGTASAVLLASSPHERQRGSLRGAVVAGLGKYDGSLTVGKLTDATRTACLRYLVHVQDSGVVSRDPRTVQEIKLNALLLGYNSSANLTVADSVQALLRGVADANEQFASTSGSRLRIAHFDIVEIYLDTALTAVHAARQVAQGMNAEPRARWRIEVDPLLHQGEGMRHRLFESRAASYWPRLMITDAATAEPAPGVAVAPAKPFAERLRYLYLGQRARAESLITQRQPGLVERLVERQLTRLVYDAEFSRSLFQLLVPHDFKDAARQMQQMVFVVDATTANLPWELMLADDEPLAVRTAMVRQLTSSTFRQRVNQTQERRAYVIGNPSTAGWFTAFPDPRVDPSVAAPAQLDDLPAAEREAGAVTEMLSREGFEVERAIGRDQQAGDVIGRLYKHPYRIVHIAGHGVFEAQAADGGRRSGVVLGDGLLITAAEIDAMEVVPELVFVNCCHLGRIDAPAPTAAAYNKLAASLARELIDIGVRAVVVAGWAVEDAPASLFADTFYERLLNDGLVFGDAVFQARRATWERHPASITWGAYQAYGDPGWRADPRVDRTVATLASSGCGAAPEELLDRIESERVALQRAGETITRADAERVHGLAQQWLKAMPAGWAQRPDVFSALGDLYADLGPDYHDPARDCYTRAMRGPDDGGRVTIRTVEQIAVLEARMGQARGDAALVSRAIDRLVQLMRITDTGIGTGPAAQDEQAPPHVHPKRAGLLGSVWKRKAAVHARRYLDGDAGELQSMTDALKHSAAAYQSAATDPATGELRPYQTLNWLYLQSLLAPPSRWAGLIPQAERCIDLANAAYEEAPDAWNSTMVADAALVKALLRHTLAAASNAGDEVAAGLATHYRDTLDSALASPKERDAVVKQIELLALFHEAQAQARRRAWQTTVAARLRTLAQGVSAPRA